MKKAIVYLIVLLGYSFSGYAQDIINNPGTQTNEAIQQVSVSGFYDIISLQDLNSGLGNYANARQVGSQNQVTINQKTDAIGFSNQSYNFQEGNFNEMNVGQVGSGNLLLSYQIGYLTSLSLNNSLGLWLDGNMVSTGVSNESNATLNIGERNSLHVSQDGSNNGIMAIQQGTGHTIDVGQKGSNNYLAILQKGINNSVNGYIQGNTESNNLFETVTQLGDNLSLIATDISGSKLIGNVFKQSGANLTLEVNNGLINTMGGIEINQTGQDMKVVVDQSYFSFPLQ